MAHLGHFNADEHPHMDMQPVPPGEYLVEITNSELKATKDGEGQYLTLEFTIAGGQHDGRKIWTNLNIANKNEKAEKIARANLGDIIRAVGLRDITDSEQLHNRRLVMGVKVKPASGQYEARNEPTSYKQWSGAPSNAPAHQQPAAANPFAGQNGQHAPAAQPPANPAAMRPQPGAAPPWAGQKGQQQ